jgi:hypothetical protein
MGRTGILGAGFAAVLVCSAAAPAFADNGAFARDEAAGKSGHSWNEPNEKKAEEAALKDCGTDKCKIVFKTKAGECSAFATNDDGKIWGAAKRPKRDAAEKAALANCQKRTKTGTGQCKMRGSECNK